MSEEIQMARLYDGRGNIVTQWNPRFTELQQELRFSMSYNPVPERRGRATPLVTKAGSENWAGNRDRLRSMADARDAAQYDWIGGVLARVVLYVCGRLHVKSNTGDGQIDQLQDDYFHNWCGDERADDGTTRCDITGRHRFLKMVQMAFLAFLVDGDYGFVEVDPLFSPTGEFCLQGIEADRLGSPIEALIDENYIGGITLDPITGRIVSYRVYRRTRSNMYVDKQEIPVDAFLHVFDPDRSDEYRGRTKLLRCLNDLRDIREWIEAEKVAGKSQAQWAALVATKDPFNGNGPSAWQGKTDAGTPTQEAQWGKIMQMGEGENFSMLSPSARPSGAFMAFIQLLIRKMSLSIGLSYGLLWDLATLGGATARIELQADLRKIQYWQENLLGGLIIKRVRNKVIAQGIAQGAIPPTPRWKECTLNWGPHITADLGYEMEADITAISHGIVSVEGVIAKHTGQSAREVFESNATTFNTAIEVGSENGAPVETFAAGMYPNGTDQKAAYLTPAPIPPPPPGSIDAIGDKGVGKLTELLIAVGEGKIDREHAINSIVQIFGIPRSKAEKMVPDEPAEEDLNRAAGLDVNGRHAPVVAAPKSASSNGARPKSKK